MSSRFILVPRADGIFQRLDLMSRNVFGLIYDRWKLSNKPRNIDAFTDAFGVYCVFDRQDMANELGVTLPTVRKAINLLIDAGILKARRAGPCAAWRYYVSAAAQIQLDDEFAKEVIGTLDTDRKILSL